MDHFMLKIFLGGGRQEFLFCFHSRLVLFGFRSKLSDFFPIRMFLAPFSIHYCPNTIATLPSPILNPQR